MKPIDVDTSINKWEQDIDIDEMIKDTPIMSADEWRLTYDEREKQIAEITEKIRKQILAHIDFANPDEVEVEYCSHTLYSIKYYGVQLDLIAIYRDEETVECDELYEIVFSYDEVERIGQMAMLLDEARDKWGIE